MSKKTKVYVNEVEMLRDVVKTQDEKVIQQSRTIIELNKRLVDYEDKLAKLIKLSDEDDETVDELEAERDELRAELLANNDKCAHDANVTKFEIADLKAELKEVRVAMLNAGLLYEEDGKLYDA